MKYRIWHLPTTRLGFSRGRSGNMVFGYTIYDEQLTRKRPCTFPDLLFLFRTGKCQRHGYGTTWF